MSSIIVYYSTFQGDLHFPYRYQWILYLVQTTKSIRWIDHQRRPGFAVDLLYVWIHWGRDKMAATINMTFSNAFSWMKMYEFWFKFPWHLFLRVYQKYSSILSDNEDQATSHYLNQWWPRLPTHICVTRPSWVLLCSRYDPRIWLLMGLSSSKHCTDKQYFAYLYDTCMCVTVGAPA